MYYKIYENDSIEEKAKTCVSVNGELLVSGILSTEAYEVVCQRLMPGDVVEIYGVERTAETALKIYAEVYLKTINNVSTWYRIQGFADE